MKEHLACTHKDVAACPNVPLEVKNEIKQFLKDFEDAKYASQRNFQKMVDGDAYFVGGRDYIGSANHLEGMNSCPSVCDRGVRGPMVRFVANKEDDGKGKQMQANAKEHRNQVCMNIARCFYENGISFNIASSPSFVNMVRSIGNYGPGLKLPSRHEVGNWMLKEEVTTTSATVDEIKMTWKKIGVSLLSDGWSDMRNRSLINFLVNNQYGTVFLKTVDASDCVKDAKKIIDLLDSVIEEIGEDIVVHVVTDNASAYKSAGQMFIEKRKSLYWTPCAAHCIDLMLEKIRELPQQKNALFKAKRVSNFIHNHQ